MDKEEEPQIIDFDAEKKKKKDKKDKKDKKEKKDKDGEEVDDEKKEKKDKKKKDKKDKKEKKEAKNEDDEEEKETQVTEDKHDNTEEQNDDLIIDFTAEKKKKKAKKEKKSKFDDAAGEEEEVQKTKTKEPVQIPSKRIDLNKVEGHESFDYKFLLGLITETIKKSSSSKEEGASGHYKLIEPQCSRTKTKSTWINFDEQATALNRDHKHILAYFVSELGCVGNIGSINEMTLVGGYQAKHYNRLIRKYIEDYVKCNNCKGFNTDFIREDRLTYLKCNRCKASRTVAAIASRYQAARRGERRRERQK